MESLFKNIGEFRGVKHMNCGATKHTEQRYKYPVDWYVIVSLWCLISTAVMIHECKTITPTYVRLVGGLCRTLMGTGKNFAQLHCEVIRNNQ